MEKGYLTCAGEPGLGVSLNPDYLADYPFEAEHLPILHRA